MVLKYVNCLTNKQTWSNLGWISFRIKSLGMCRIVMLTSPDVLRDIGVSVLPSWRLYNLGMYRRVDHISRSRDVDSVNYNGPCRFDPLVA